MRIESVTAHAFGPLSEQTLTLAPGLTVVAGANESGKSSWHAAIYSALYGRPAERHRPWTGDGWKVSATVTRDDGRPVELVRDLNNDDEPDADYWLGMDRESFAATACVSQAQLLSVLSAADGLQQHLKQATDLTVPAALDRLRAHHDVVVAAQLCRERVNKHSAELARQAKRLQRMQELDARFGQVQPSGLAAQEELASTVNLALAAWRAAPVPRQLTGPSAADLTAELAALPEPPDGPVALDDELREIAAAHEAAVAVATAHADREPPECDQAVDPLVLRELAMALDPSSAERVSAAAGAVDVARQQQDEAAVAAARTQVQADVAMARLHEQGVPGRPRWSVSQTMLLALAVTTALIGLLLLGIGYVVPAILVVVTAAFTGVAAAMVPATLPPGHAAASAHASETAANANTARGQLFLADRGLAEAEGQHAVAVERARGHIEAEQRCAELQVPASPEKLLALGTRPGWEAQRKEYAQEVEETASRLLKALRERGKTEPDMSATELLVDYETDCKVRARQAMMAAQRGVLTQALADREAAEATVTEAASTRAEALKLLREAVQAVHGEADASPHGLLQAIADWQRGWDDLLRTADEERNAWAELVSLREETSVEGFAAMQAEHAALLEETVQAERLLDDDVDLSTIELTMKFLETAQERAHRDLVPILEATLRKWLPVVTGGRYVDATLDPVTLQVQVCGPSREWHPADDLSIGTAEQVYLLSRFALAEHLATETCPLLLDDVTVQADDIRTRAILDLLLRLSEERQIVLFAQESAVLDWARAHLDDERHQLHQLSPVLVA